MSHVELDVGCFDFEINEVLFPQDNLFDTRKSVFVLEAVFDFSFCVDPSVKFTTNSCSVLGIMSKSIKQRVVNNLVIFAVAH